MPTVTCPVEGFEHISVTYPDVWTVRDHDKFWRGYREAGDVTHNTALLYGSIATCSKIDGLDRDDVGDWPVEILYWLVDTIFVNGLDKVANRSKKNLSLESLIMPTQ